MRQQVLAQLRATRPEMAAQAEALLANPGMLQGAVQVGFGREGSMVVVHAYPRALIGCCSFTSFIRAEQG